MKSLIEGFSLAFRQLKTKKIRTLLILLGISVGVAAVVGVTSLGEGIRVNAIDKIQKSHDLTLIEVHPGVSNGNLILITESKVRTVKKYGSIVSPYVSDDYITQNKTHFKITGISKDYVDARDLDLESGRWFEKGTYHIVLGSDLGEKFITIEAVEIEDTIETTLRLYGEEGRAVDKDVFFTVVGILKPAGTDTDNLAFMDITTAQELDEKDVYDGIIVKVDKAGQAPAARSAIEKLELTCYSAQDEIDSVNRIMNAVTIVLAFFSGISLIVGGLMIIARLVFKNNRPRYYLGR